jgi:hypothetical protein
VGGVTGASPEEEGSREGREEKKYAKDAKSSVLYRLVRVSLFGRALTRSFGQSAAGISASLRVHREPSRPSREPTSSFFTNPAA